MELVTLGIFCAALVGAIFTGVPTVCALLVGLAAFCIYAWRWSGSVRRVARMCGAALSGAFFGDRCSPISTSALLVADLTGTDFYNNLKRMVKSAAVPFVLTCAAYFALGLLVPASGEAGDMAASLASAFAVGPVVLLPPVIVFALALMRVDILVVIGAGIASSVPLCLAVQDMTMADVVRTAILGYVAPLPQVRALSGGERQRVYLAMALAQGGTTILLDEPGAFLDVRAQFELLDLLRSVAAGGKAVVLVMHELPQAMQYADRIALLGGGRLLGCDTSAALAATGAVDRVFGVRLCRAPDGVWYVKAEG